MPYGHRQPLLPVLQQNNLNNALVDAVNLPCTTFILLQQTRVTLALSIDPTELIHLPMQNIAPLFRLLALITLAFNLIACSTQKLARDENWPQTMPPRSYFVTAFEADEANKKVQAQQEYLTWIVRFYNGWELYNRGWTKMTDELLAQVHDPAEARAIKPKIDRIGRLVSAEWAKKSDTRTIYLRHVSIWGNALLESLDRDQALELVTKVNQDVDDLLAHKIKPAVITAERYFPADEDDPFL